VVPAKAAILVLAASCAARQATDEDSPIGNLVAFTLPSADGDVVDLGRWRGRVGVLHLALTGSLDAQSDVEELRRTREAHRGLALAEIVFDDAGERLAVPWANASAIDWSVLLPTAQIRSGQSALGLIRVLPTTFVIGRDGRVVWRWEGALPRGRLQKVVDAVARGR
jgi:hypothetical protein